MSEPGRPANATRLAQRRRAVGLSQLKLAELTGISLSTIQRMERGREANPKMRPLANCALVLGCKIEALIEPDWRQWWPVGGPKPPTRAAIAEAVRASFKPPPGRSPKLEIKTEEMSPSERKRRARLKQKRAQAK